MKIYLKILSITAALQLISIIIVFKGNDIINAVTGINFLGAAVGGVLLVVSIILGVVLPIKWYKKNWQKFCGIVLLPTNYSWLVVGTILKKSVDIILNILFNVPENFG